jgi:hypothetical protein
VVISTSLHWAWESAVGSNSDPLPTETGVSTDKWLSIGPTNRYRMFDLDSSSATTGASPLTVTIAPGERFDAVGLVGLVADSVTFTLKSGATTIFTETRSLLTRITRTWTEYLYGKFRQVKEAAWFDLPQNSAFTVELTFTRDAGDVSVGGVVIGQSIYLGRALHGARPGALNFSRFERTETGAPSQLVKRPMVPRVAMQIRSKATDLAAILQAREDLDATVALYSGLDNADHPYFASLLVLGVWTRFEPELDQAEELLTDLEIEKY